LPIWHQVLFQLAHDPAALCERRVRRRLRYHPGDVPGRRAAGPLEDERCPGAGNRSDLIGRAFTPPPERGRSPLFASLAKQIMAGGGQVADTELSVIIAVPSGTP